MDIWRVLDVNPEPWVVPPFTVIRNKQTNKMIPKAGKSQQLAAFQDAVREALEDNQQVISGDIRLVFYFWRRLDSQISEGKRRTTRNQADATNMQKATEDALQGVFFGNDRNVRDIRSVLVDHGAEVTPRIVLHVEPWVWFNPDEIPQHVWNLIDKQNNLFELTDKDRNVWPPVQ